MFYEFTGYNVSQLIRFWGVQPASKESTQERQCKICKTYH